MADPSVAPKTGDGVPLADPSGLFLWLRLYEPLLLVVVLALGGFYAVYRAPAAAWIGLVIAFVVLPLTRRGHLQLRAGRLEPAVLTISLGLWTITLAAALIGATFFVDAVMVSVGSIILAVPYTSERSVRRAVLCSLLASSLAAICAFREPVFTAEPLPEVIMRLIAVSLALIILMLYALIAWQASRRLHRLVAGMRNANQALAESERQLEVKVEERTADLTLAQRDLVLARDEALAANRAKSVFLANMSHELRTPLNAVIGYSEMLKEDAHDAGHDVYVPDMERILTSGQHLLRLINDVLDLSKIEADRIELFAETIDVEELVRGVAGTVQPMVERNGNRLELGGLDNAGMMHSDVTRTRQILLNLLSNAAKFTRDGVIRITVARSVAHGSDVVTLCVADSGIGMTPDQLTHIFEAFSQAEASTTRDYGGTGLGLTITRRFCRMLGGDVHVASELGAGTEFRVVLPARMPETDPAVAESAEAESGGAEPGDGTPGVVVPDEPAPDGDVGRVLVIDDDADARTLIQRCLAASGFEVRTASGGAEGLREAQAWHPDVITLDVLMPEMDGWTVLSRLKSDQAIADIPVVLVTMLDEGNLGYMLGASDYVHKPVQREALAALLRRYVMSAAQPRVLVVDDEPAARELLLRSIDKMDVDVRQAGNGREALEEMERGIPAVILLDLSMPVMDGFQFLEALRAHSKWRAVPVVVVTSRDLTRDEWRRLDDTAQSVLQKGAYSLDELLATVRALTMASA